jgi:signal transduction histidine kinase
MRIGAVDALRPYVDQIQASAERAAGLTKGLLAFSRKQVLEPAAVRLSEVVGGVEDILRRIIGEDVELAIELGRDELPVQADSTQLDQVLMNLCTNARDAMPLGGRLTIATNLAVVDGSAGPKHLSLKDGKYMVLSVTDTGVGMDDAM